MIRVDLSRCTGCRRCEAACAFFHTGRINPELARLKVIHLYETGVVWQAQVEGLKWIFSSTVDQLCSHLMVTCTDRFQITTGIAFILHTNVVEKGGRE